MGKKNNNNNVFKQYFQVYTTIEYAKQACFSSFAEQVAAARREGIGMIGDTYKLIGYYFFVFLFLAVVHCSS